MRIFNGFSDLPIFNNPIVTVGSFDGVHLGHHKLLDTLNKKAAQIGGESVVVTFSPHPRFVLDPQTDFKLLNSDNEKAELLSHAGVDNLIVVEFSESFSKLPYNDFLVEYLINKIGMRHLVVGYNHHFGHNKQGNYDYLSKLACDLRFEVVRVEKQDVGERKVSSTEIRKLIAHGEMNAAAELLNYRYQVVFNCIAVEKGTDSKEYILQSSQCEKLLPAEGIYPVTIKGVDKPSQIKIENSGLIRLNTTQEVGEQEQITVVF